MRKRFEQQLSLGVVPISEVSINLKSRHELPPLLYALQYVFKDAELSETIFGILEKKILDGKQKTGRLGMSLWEILVFGAVKLNLDIDYDFLHDYANNHEALRGILGVHRSDYRRGQQYELQTLKDNVHLLDEATIMQINEIIVKGAHGLIKKKEGVEVLRLDLKADSFVVESNIHFPTDLNLLWDSGRKCLDEIEGLKELGVSLGMFRQSRRWRSKLKSAYRRSSEIHRKKGQNYQVRLEASVKAYLSVCNQIAQRTKSAKAVAAKHLREKEASIPVYQRTKDLMYYEQMLLKHIDLVERRILKGEQIPHSEKVFSIFEPHVEWNNKGKAKGVELGHNTLIVTDQHHFILHHEVYEKQVDKQRTISIGNTIAQTFTAADYELGSISFDRNFYSKLAKQSLDQQFDRVLLPKPGYQSKAQVEEQSQADYIQKRKQHATVEANIHQLEAHGLGICRDKGIDGFKRYVAYGVLAYNLHRLGNLIKRIEAQKQAKRAKTRRAVA